METILFILFALTALVSAVMVVTGKQPIASVMFLVLTFFCLAMLYVMLGATFIAVMQIIVYAGAIMVLFIFVVMMLNLNQPQKWEVLGSLRKWIGFGAAALVLVVLAVLLREPLGLTAGLDPEMGSVDAIGTVLFNRYMLPFELVSVLLLGTIIGVVSMVKRQQEADENPTKGE